jgi:hypothetical protein
VHHAPAAAPHHAAPVAHHSVHHAPVHHAPGPLSFFGEYFVTKCYSKYFIL